MLQPFQFGVDGGSAGEVGVEGGLLGVHRWLRGVIGDTTMNALFNQEAKLLIAAIYCWMPLCHTDTLSLLNQTDQVSFL